MGTQSERRGGSNDQLGGALALDERMEHLSRFRPITFLDKPDTLGLSVDKTERELRLEREVTGQWLANHGEHCGEAITQPYPHSGYCTWPIPSVVAELAPNRIYSLLAEFLGEPAELRLQEPEC